MITNELYLLTHFLVSTASPLDAITVFLNKLFGSNHTPDGYLMALLVLCGLLVIGLVLLYNWWEERKFTQQVEKSFAPINNDALLDQNKKQFLDKFAATTGYLSDEPDANSFGGQKPAEIADDKSIDDVYSELLDTMQRRTQQKVSTEPQKVQSFEGAPQNVEHFNLPNMMIEPKDAPLNQSTFENLSAQENAESSVNEESPEHYNKIRSIIDQVFRSKGYVKPVPSATEPTQSIKLEVQKETHKDDSALDAYLSVKNSIAQEIVQSQYDTNDAAQQTGASVATADSLKNEGIISGVETAHAPSLKESVSGLTVVKNQTDEPPVLTDKPTSNEAASAAAVLDPQPLPSTLNSQTDFIGEIALLTPVALEHLIDSFSALHRDFDKPVFVHMQDAKYNWLLVDNANKPNLLKQIEIKAPQKIVCSLQLADRSGAVSRNVISRFQMACESIAINLGSKVEWHNEGDVFSQAMALDAFCIEVDKTMFFHLMHESTGPFTGIKLKGIAESQGLVLGNDGTFKFFGEANAKYPEFVMFNRDNHPFNPEMLRTSVVKAITFQLDIPHTLPQAAALDHMLSVAKYMEVGLNAVLVDDNNRPLADLQIERIRDQIKSIHAMMQLRGILPGSDIAHRLFS
jgi:FtsZ-interacting cell division protein ZipA